MNLYEYRELYDRAKENVHSEAMLKLGQLGEGDGYFASTADCYRGVGLDGVDGYGSTIPSLKDARCTTCGSGMRVVGVGKWDTVRHGELVKVISGALVCAADGDHGNDGETWKRGAYGFDGDFCESGKRNYLREVIVEMNPKEFFNNAAVIAAL
ncbi:MAG: hypothetical protein E6R04_06890 [Spirochaetes bacterium]|nr:MAG: hypothetical protein E6R04_06890 [Spirochaetota bacterium]